ncbi:MAG: hypothetical protein ACM3SQ_13690 [Betaproteobacteria bacterium]
MSTPPDIRRRPNQDQERREQAAILYVKSLPASRVENDLPADKTLGAWLDDLLHAPLEWSLNDCGEGPYDDGPICAGFEDPSRELFVNIGIGTSKGGFGDEIGSGSPDIWFGEMNVFERYSPVDRLSDIPRLLKEAEDRRQRFGNHPLRTLRADEAVGVVREASASALEAGLPAQPFGTWLAGLLRPEIVVDWRLVDNRLYHQRPERLPQHVNVIVHWPDGSSGFLDFDVELVQRGMSQTPTFSGSEIYDRKAIRITGYSSLSDFADGVRKLNAGGKR